MKKKSKSCQRSCGGGDLVLDGHAGRQDGHADELGEAAVHGVDGDGGGVEAEDVGHVRDVRPLGEAAQEQHVRGMLVGEDVRGPGR